MVKPEADESLEPYSAEAIEVMVDYYKGLWSLDNAAKELYKLTGILPQYGKFLLKNMKQARTVTQIRGYEKTPERLLEPHKRWREGKARAKCRTPSS